ncbi:MAG: histidine phosphatase family protein [Myxococcota bacterium]
MRTLLRMFLVLLLLAGCGDDDPATTDAMVDGSSASDADASAESDADASSETDASGDGEIPEGSTIYYIVRHTERDPGADPPINAEGIVRAQALADRLENAGIDEIITTMFIRGQQSGQPLADRLGQQITVAPFMMTTWTAFAAEVSAWQQQRETPGNTYLMIGHSGGYNTGLLTGLGATLNGTTGERYEDLVIMVREPDGTVRVTEELYGGPSSLDP